MIINSQEITLLMEILNNDGKIIQPFSTIAKNIINVSEMEVICSC